MKLGDTGNGFDFQIKPYGHGGHPAAVTSTPYPIVDLGSFDSRPEGPFDIEIVQIVEDYTVSSQALSGTIRDTLIRTYQGPDSIDATIELVSGTLAQILKSTNGDDEFDSLHAVARSGTIKSILIRVFADEGERDGFDGIHATATGGTLS